MLRIPKPLKKHPQGIQKTQLQEPPKNPLPMCKKQRGEVKSKTEQKGLENILPFSLPSNAEKIQFLALVDTAKKALPGTSPQQPNTQIKNVTKIHATYNEEIAYPQYAGIIQEKNGVYLDDVSVFRKLQISKVKGVTEIIKIGKARAKILFKTATEANTFMRETSPLGNNLEAYMPLNTAARIGIIKDVPINLSDEERLARFNPEDPKSPIPTKTLKLTFHGTTLPKQIKLGYCIRKVDFYFPKVKQCQNCARLEHTKKWCKSAQRCLTCGASPL
ncbi:unnamed protein product [Hermetia illucens]|uniref:Uncharacterized protein n=1 Tax=Hermetia illucens TaxID=343691 RepID=A0A7R8YRG2_HERIL|nr:unnamed protein product [Hermetia illucens]